VGHSFAFWFWVVGDHPSALMSHQSVTSVKAVRGTHQSVTSVKAVRGTHQSVTSVKAVVARGAVAACNGAATRSGRPRQPTHHAQWEAIAHDRASRRKQLAAQMGGRQNPTHTGAAQTPYTSALARCGRRSPLGPISPFQRRRAATRRAEPVSAGDLGAARDAGMRDGSVGSVPKADRLGCELRQPPFLYPLDHVQAVGGRDGWPRAGGGEGVRR
jgi:hypothetical protein